MEWLEVDGLGGFALGSADLIPRRRYHSLLVTSTKPPTERFSLLQAVEVFVHLEDGRNFPLSSFSYTGNYIHPRGNQHITRFTGTPWPTWDFKFSEEISATYELTMLRDPAATVLSWKVNAPAGMNMQLSVRPLFSGRDYHHMHRERSWLRLGPHRDGERISWSLEEWLPKVAASSEGTFVEDPRWYYNFFYEEEAHREYDAVEDLATPGYYLFPIQRNKPALIVWAGGAHADQLPSGKTKEWIVSALEQERTRRSAFQTPLERAADLFLVKRGSGKTIIAGYPWFTDWGRDTFISMRGICLARGLFEDAREILLEWSREESLGMLPNRFPDRGETPEFNSVDASLWFNVVAYELIRSAPSGVLDAASRTQLIATMRKIVVGYRDGTRFGIKADTDAMLRCGEPGSQLTWMDAKVGERAITPRIGKPVEIQALWYNSLRALAELDGAESPWAEKLAARVADSFAARFFNRPAKCLFDVVDCEHRAGADDGRIRPNQVLAVAGLPFSLVSGADAIDVIQTVEQKLFTVGGMRTLDPDSPDYRGTYIGGMKYRDEAYHQGTAWYWLLGPFIEAWVRVHGETPEAKREARERFLDPVLARFAGSGLIAEIAEGNSPHRPDGCPAQAWSVAELLRIERKILA